MTIYKEMYLHLFNAVTDALQKLAEQDTVETRRILESAQQWCESAYIESGSTVLSAREQTK